MVGPTRIAKRRTRVPVYAFRTEPGVPHVQVLRINRSTADGVGAHVHQFPGIAYFEAAGGAVRIGDRRERIVDGSGFLIRPGEVVSVEETDALAGSGGWGLYFTPSAVGESDGLGDRRLLWQLHPLLAMFVVDGGPTSFAVAPHDRPMWRQHLRAVEQEMDRRRTGYQLAAQARLVLLLVEAERLTAAAPSNAVPDSVVERVFEVIEQCYRDRLSLADVAESLNFSPGHLTTEMRQRTGRTVHEWITERRLIEARRLLVETDLTVAEVGRRCGYPDAGYFSRVFRRSHALSPREWRAVMSGARTGGAFSTDSGS